METTEQLEAEVESLLIREEPTGPEAQPEVAAPEPEAQEDEAQEVEAEQDAETEDPEAEETEPAKEAATSKYTVKADGKEIEVTLDDLKRSYSGQAYIQKGMQDAAEARKQASEIFQTLQNEQARFLQAVETVKQQGFKLPPQAPDIALMDKDPIGYMQAEARYRKDVTEFQTQQAEVHRIAQQQRDLQGRALSEYVKEQGKLLQERIPDFADPKKARDVAAKIRATASEAYGFTEQELGGVVDARHVQVLHDAMKWRELQAARTKQAPRAAEVNQADGASPGASATCS